MENRDRDSGLSALQIPQETVRLLEKIEESQLGFKSNLQGPYGPRRSKSG